MEKKKTKQYLGTRINPDVLAKVKAMAAEQDRSTSHMVEILLRKAVEDK